jgi:mRNA-degrading endonuclease RelE of RelBE toxin-antitoxin system
MRHEIILAPDAAEAYKKLAARIRSRVRDALEVHLRYEPTKVSRSRIKRLRGVSRPQYRLRIDEIRVFYDVKETTAEILAILQKADAQKWLDKEATPNSGGRAGKS